MMVRKIVHIDMDAFYASVEQRDDPQLRGKPVIVAWRGNRSVVCAASYEARRFGVRSAMPAVRAERLCPNAVFLPPDFLRYRAVSRQAREIFQRHTDLIEPLSLDEAYLDVSDNKTGLPTATQVARAIREQIRAELHPTASAGVAPNKFLAKIASDWRKPDGLFVIPPVSSKEFKYRALKRTWISVFRAVSQATELQVLGYSLPREDQFARFVLRRAIRNNLLNVEKGKKSALSVKVINPDETVWATFSKLVGASQNNTRMEFVQTLFQDYVSTL